MLNVTVLQISVGIIQATLANHCHVFKINLLQVKRETINVSVFPDTVLI